LLYHWATRDHG